MKKSILIFALLAPIASTSFCSEPYKNSAKRKKAEKVTCLDLFLAPVRGCLKGILEAREESVEKKAHKWIAKKATRLKKEK